jgi:hypothetical protein
MSAEPLVRLPEWRPLQFAIRVTRLDLRPSMTPPSVARTLVGIAVGVVLSVSVNWLIVRAGVAIFPATASFPHFRFADYGRLTLIGAVIACAGWPIVARLSSSPGWPYGWIAVLGTLALWLPDLYIWAVLKEPGHAVLVLATMHLAVPLVSCLSMVTIARPR